MSKQTATAVLDASALLALFLGEQGAERVKAAVSAGALISAVNWAEVLSRLVQSGGDPFAATTQALPQGDAGRLVLVPFDDDQARETARLRPRTSSLGLSLADRAALALARIRGLPVLTTDRAWRSLRLSIRIEVIR